MRTKMIKPSEDVQDRIPKSSSNISFTTVTQLAHARTYVRIYASQYVGMERYGHDGENE